MSQNTSYGLNGSRIPSMHFGGAKSATKTSSMSLSSVQSSTSSLYRGGPSFGGTFIAGGGGGYRDESSYRNDLSYSASSHRQKSTGGLFNKRPGYYSSSAKKSSNGSLGLFSTTPRPNRSNLQLSSSTASKYANSTGRRNTMTNSVSQDPRNTQDTAFQQSVYKKIVAFLTSHEFPEHLSTNFMRFPNKHTMIKIFRFLFEFLLPNDPSVMCIDTQFEHVIPELMAKLGYPPKVNKSSLQSFTGVRNLAVLHGILDYLVNIILYKENLCPEDFLPNADNDREALAKKRFLLDDIFDNDLDDDLMVTRMEAYLGQKFHGSDEINELESQEEQLEARLLELNEKGLACGEVSQELNTLTERLAELETLEAQLAAELSELESSYNHSLQDMAALTRRQDFLLKEIQEIETTIANQKVDRGQLEAQSQRKRHLVREIESEETQIQQLKQEETSILNNTKSAEYELSKLACDLVSYVNSIRLTYALPASKGDSERVSKDLGSPEWERVVEALSKTASGEIKLDVPTLEKFSSLMAKNRELIAESFSDVQEEINSLKKKHDLFEKKVLTIESKLEEETKNLENDQQEHEEIKLRSEEELKKLNKKHVEVKEDYQILSQAEDSFQTLAELNALRSKLEDQKKSAEEEEHQWVIDLQAKHEQEKSELECLHKALKRFNEMLTKDVEIRKVHLKVEKYLATGVRKWLEKEKKKKTTKTDEEEQKKLDKKEKEKEKKKAKKEKEKEKKAAGGDKKKDAGPAKKGPGAKQLALIKETLKKKQEEEDQRIKEEEERIKREEEAERERLEQLQREKEKKEKKKQKEKERKERLKKEGKLLSAKQKADRQRAKLSLEIAKQQGLIVIGKERKEGEQKDKPRKYTKLHKQTPGEGDNKVTSQEGKLTEISEKDGDLSNDESEEIENWEELGDENMRSSSSELETNGEQANKENVKSNKSSEPVSSPSAKVNDKKPENDIKSGQRSRKSSETSESSVKTPTSHDKTAVSTIKEEKSSPPELRSPVICVLGHVDTGKTKLLDYIRHSHVQDHEAGGITQQIGATFIPPSAVHDQTKHVKNVAELKLPGLLTIDTPGHESFSNLRSRGSSLCDIAILVVDIMHGLEPQTIESLNMLKSRKTPFIIALNKIDRLYSWNENIKSKDKVPGNKDKLDRTTDVEELIKSQPNNTKLEFQERVNTVIREMNENEMNAALFYSNPDPKVYVSMVPTSAFSGAGMGNLINLIVTYSQERLRKRLMFDPDNLRATVLEVKAMPGLGTTIDVILVNGKLCEGDRIIMAGHDGPFETNIRSLLVPQPLKELRVKCAFETLKTVYGSMGVKITGHDLDKTIAGLELHVARNEDNARELKEICWRQFGDAMKAIKCSDKGVYVQASTLGSLEALLKFLKDSKISYSGVRIGPVVRKDVMKASVMLEIAPDYAVILAFDVKVERDAQELADQLGVKIFTAEIIYHLFDKFTAYRDDIKQKRKEQYRNVAVFPCKLRILPQFIFRDRDPIIVGVSVEDGLLVTGTPLAVLSKESVDLGRVSSIEINNKPVESARRGQEVCIKIEATGSDGPRQLGRHFEATDMIASRITRESIDVVKEYFRDDLQKSDWQLIMELKKAFHVI
ncbi:eukaryotic translation initiation factor 5B [Brevipalpus obovatus]|uniref:eukaryotic translation initiation factor 5B n=1 Tax=Brevipalpus obovatus TaxID=246614 RepID=UPI003D9F5AF9